MNRKTYGLVALICGIVGFVTGGIASIIGLIFAILGKRLPDDGDQQTTTFLTVGLILSIISLAAGALICLGCFICPCVTAASGLASYY
jgi:uncharacterized membrane protein